MLRGPLEPGGDPNLHTHVVIANKVQGPDGRWRSLDSRALHHAAVACSELYDTLLADAIGARLPVAWSWRGRGERRSPAFEIDGLDGLDGLDDDLLAAFSSRSVQIAAAVHELLEEFRIRHDREPTRREVLRLRQQATLATRPDKTVRPLPELLRRWRRAAAAATGTQPGGDPRLRDGHRDAHLLLWRMSGPGPRTHAKSACGDGVQFRGQATGARLVGGAGRGVLDLQPPTRCSMWTSTPRYGTDTVPCLTRSPAVRWH